VLGLAADEVDVAGVGEVEDGVAVVVELEQRGGRHVAGVERLRRHLKHRVLGQRVQEPCANQATSSLQSAMDLCLTGNCSRSNDVLTDGVTVREVDGLGPFPCRGCPIGILPPLISSGDGYLLIHLMTSSSRQLALQVFFPQRLCPCQPSTRG
jgi:hypothetical protein